MRLTSQGITGTSYLEVDFVDPKNAPLLEIAWIPDNLYVPSAPSAVNQLLASADEIMTRLRKLDLDSTIENFNRVMVGAARNVDELKLGELSTSARALSKYRRASCRASRSAARSRSRTLCSRSATVAIRERTLVWSMPSNRSRSASMDSRARILVLPTDEERAIARDAVALIG